MAAESKQENAIVVDHVKKHFKVFLDKGQSFKERLLFRKRRRYENRQVLRDISFTVKRGEAVGLIGHNGCGKSTTLKLLTRILYPDSGTITIQGRVSSLIELGAGFHPDMSGRENIYTNASIFGLSKKEIDARLQTIIDFSELEPFIDNPVRTYSSGMYMRLAFSVAINVDADVLLIDEILGVGDVNFQAKCFQKLQEIKADGTTIVIVSHSMGQIEQICDRCIWIEDGLIKEEGIPKYVDEHYLSEMEQLRLAREEAEHQKEHREKETDSEQKPEGKSEDAADQETLSRQKLPAFCEKSAVRLGTGQVQFTDAALLAADGTAQYVFRTGDEITLRLKYHCAEPEKTPRGNFGYGIFREDSVHCYGTNVEIESDSWVALQKDGEIQVRFRNHLLPGRYFLDVAVHAPDGTYYDDIRRIQAFAVTSEHRDIGVCRLERCRCLYAGMVCKTRRQFFPWHSVLHEVIHTSDRIQHTAQYLTSSVIVLGGDHAADAVNGFLSSRAQQICQRHNACLVVTAVQQHHGIFPQQFRSCRNTHLGKGIVRHCRRNQIAVHSQESNHLDSSHGVVHLVTPRHMERIGETVVLEHRLLQRFRKDTAVLHIGDHQLCIFLLCCLLHLSLIHISEPTRRS